MYNQRPWAKCQHNSSFKGSELTLRLSNFPPAVPFSLCAFSACGSALLFSSIYIIGCLVCCVTTYISEFRSPSFLDWVSSKIQIPMDALQIHRTSSTCISSLRSASTPPTLGLLGQVRFAPLCNRRGRVFLHRTRSVRDRNEGEFRRFRNRSSAVEGEEETEIILGAERDGRIIGFHLVPESDDEEVVDSDSTTSATKTIEEEIEGVKGEEPQVRVTHNIVFVTAEAAPYSKTGGLGDVCASLPVALSAHGHRVMVVSPRYLNGSPSDKKFSGAYDVQCRIKIPCFGALQEVAFFHEYRAGVDWVFVDHPSYQRPGNPYGDNYGAFGDNQFRFTLLCHAACEAPLVIPLGGFTYGEKCLFLVNDWHASLVPVLLAASYRPHGVYKDARSILIIHNLAHQGVEPAATYSNLGLPPEWYGAMGWIFPNWARTHALDTGEAVNFLKGAIVTADRILTVSEGYSWEITTPEGGYGLHDLLSSRKNVLNGITNGIDVIEWNPASDEHISSCYSVHDLAGKAQCKSALQKELGLPVRPECPMIGFIGRLDNQKGIDLIQSAIPELMQDDIQFVMLGSGDPQYEDWMKATESTYRDKFRGWVGFNVPISHRITAGCDILLMPSRFEPCGLNQLYAMRYGTVPVVHSTGGLRDTVKNFNPYAKEGNDQGTGWTFSPLSKENMLAALRVAIRTYREHKSSWEGLMKRGMERDCTWDNAAVQYEQVFEWAFSVPPYVQ
ncbi:PREDICTED: soluble starch synthase 1, chloroplastic/amyloplastic isoform X2 [Nelumbo nucifera]|uniref:Starch synthase, chloroplastic/amyloplastic n=1 Tax=Nelumbo nucifera TaxID=4432 RepID=A0A1U8Q749_NELNU|nr:PREDICTED: soluble starch synthase 1, chloroplastic/amyloplastic isoform X2 [Nelumbo nucifera]